MNKIIALAILLISATATAEPFNGRGVEFPNNPPMETPRHGVLGPLLDLGTTAAGIAYFGAVEANPAGATPLGLAPIIGGKLAAEIAAPRWPERCYDILVGSHSFGFGAAAWNIATIAGASAVTAGAAALIGLAGSYYWFVRDEATERCYETVTATVSEVETDDAMAALIEPRIIAKYGPPNRVVIRGWRYRQ